MKPVSAIAHRGASHCRPENTCLAFDEALRQGCDGIELDVQLSSDGVPVIYHDSTLVKVGGGRIRLARAEAETIRRLDAGSWFAPEFHRARIPTLDEVLEHYGGRTELLIEIKVHRRDTPEWLEALARATARRVEDRNLAESTWILCFEARVLEAVAQCAPRLRRVLNLKPPPRPGRGLATRLSSLQALSTDVRTLTARFGAAVAEHGRPLFVYTCNTRMRVRAALRAGATAIMSDKPAWLAAVLTELGVRDRR